MNLPVEQAEDQPLGRPQGVPQASWQILDVSIELGDLLGQFCYFC